MNVLSATFENNTITLECESCVAYTTNSVAEDLITVLCRTKNGALYFTKQLRGSETNCQLVVIVPVATKENIEFVYAFVTSADGKKASNSIYVKLD